MKGAIIFLVIVLALIFLCIYFVKKDKEAKTGSEALIRQTNKKITAILDTNDTADTKCRLYLSSLALGILKQIQHAIKDLDLEEQVARNVENNRYDFDILAGLVLGEAMTIISCMNSGDTIPMYEAPEQFMKKFDVPNKIASPMFYGHVYSMYKVALGQWAWSVGIITEIILYGGSSVEMGASKESKINLGHDLLSEGKKKLSKKVKSDIIKSTSMELAGDPYVSARLSACITGMVLSISQPGDDMNIIGDLAKLLRNNAGSKSKKQ